MLQLMLQLSYDKNIMYENKKAVSDKPWLNMLHDKTIPSWTEPPEVFYEKRWS